MHELTPSLGCELEVSRREFPQINGGWFYLYPGDAPGDRLISDFVDDNLAVLAFGRLVRPSSSSMAETIAEAWRAGGVDEVRNIDGIFGGVVIDLSQGTVYILSDIIGTRTLKWFANGDTILISPHDAAIVATGLCRLEYDLDSAASLVACDWSLGGRALLKTVNIGDPNEYVEWKGGRVRKIACPALLQGDRIGPGDMKARDLQIDRMIEKMRDDARVLCGDAPKIQVELTAGIDSRTVASVLLSVVDSGRILAVTGGGPENFEVKTAARIARRYDFDHDLMVPSAENSTAFEPHSRLLAFISNGTANSKRAARALPSLDLAYPPTFIGNGSEIYQGFYYPSALRKPSLAKYTTGDVVRYLRRCLPVIGRLKWQDPETAERLLSRLSERVGTLESISSNGADILNLFYLYERYCRWGPRPCRSTWVTNRFSLFNSPALVRLAYQLPSPICQDYLLYRRIVKKFMPKAYRWLVNGTTYMPLLGYPKAAKAFSEGMIRLKRAKDALGKRLPSANRKLGVDELAGDIFSTHLADYIRDLLLSDGSLSQQILCRDALEDMLDEQFSGKRNHIHTIGFMVTLEQWKRLLEQARGMATNV